jgi:F420-dependent oxidoreductase-like protein
MKLSVLFPETRSLDAVCDLAVRSEAQGFHGLWLGSAFGFDPITALALAGRDTTRIRLGVAVVPTWPRHPLVMAQQAATATAACGGRFRLGIGPGHEPVMRMYGIEFDRPVGHVREYVTVVRTLLHEGTIAHDGEHYRVNAFLDVEGGVGPDAPTAPVLLGVLRPQMARLAGSHADGALCWLTPAPYLRDVIAPAMTAGAADADRPTPPMIAELPCALTTDRDAVHEMAARDLAVYPHMPFYRALFEAAGVALDGRKWSDGMIDAAVLYGDEEMLAAKVRAFFGAGADEVVLSPFGVGADPAASQADCLRVLGDLSKGVAT